jgi:hypothetical protein
MTEQDPNATCVWCDEPATGRVRIGRRQCGVGAYALHKAQAERKNLYMPCVIGAEYEDMTPAEQARVWKDTYWADNITNAEWPAVLRHEGVKAYVRSKLKRKAVGWVMALSRILWLNPTLGAQVLREADALYREQVREEPPIPWATLADLAERGWVQSGLEGWLHPLGNLRSYTPGALDAVAGKLAEDAEGWERAER